MPDMHAISIRPMASRLSVTPDLRLVLAGGGHAHLGVLADWIRQPPIGVETWLVTPDPFTVYSGMIPGWMAGYYTADQCLIDLRPLARRAGVKLVLESLCNIDANRMQVACKDGSTLPYDLLSLAIGGEVDLSSLAMLGDRLLPVRPMRAFMQRWPRVVAEAQKRPDYRLIVVGGGAAGAELALAAAHALRRKSPSARVALVTDDAGLIPALAPAVQRRLRRALAAAGIGLHFGHAAGTDAGILLADGTSLKADRVIAATGSKSPCWLRKSGIELDNQGFIAVGADLCSLSHEQIFAAGDIVSRADRPVARSGVHAVKAGPVLAANLRSAVAGGRLLSYVPNRHTLYLLATGNRRAILSWGSMALAGRLMWRLKDWIDRRFVNRFRRLAQSGQGN